MLVSDCYPLEAHQLSRVRCSVCGYACDAVPMISWTRRRGVGDQSHQLPCIPMLDKVGAFSPARGNRLSWLISENILGERHLFELKLMAEMDAMLSRRAERHNMRTLYWSQGGVRRLTIVDNIH